VTISACVPWKGLHQQATLRKQLNFVEAPQRLATDHESGGGSIQSGRRTTRGRNVGRIVVRPSFSDTSTIQQIRKTMRKSKTCKTNHGDILFQTFEFFRPTKD
jgi:hypothetical protein